MGRIIGRKTIVSLTIVITAVFWRNFQNPNRLKAPIVEISTGKLQGISSVSREGREFFEYLNIPFGKSPTGYLRFESPEPAEKWEDIRLATEYGPKCIQVDLFANKIDGQEDCLTLNVHTPEVNQNGSMETLKPVMVWMHGGLFAFGTANIYRPIYFMDADVVVVTVNYRLGSFGFLNTGDGVIRGNMGLKDQNLALRWVQENIIHFGGDPNKVTIFGESAGAASTHYHMVSPMSRGLFHKAIAQSGLVTNTWASYDYPADQAIRFAEKLNCTTTNTKLMATCLKNRTAEEIANVHLETVNPLRELITVFGPTVEVNIPDGKTFLSESGKTALENGNFAKVPLLTGVDSEEGLMNAAVIYRNDSLYDLIRSDWENWMPRLLYLSDETDPTVLARIKDYYIGGDLPSSSKLHGQIQNMTQMFTDRFFNMGFRDGVQAQISQSSAPVFVYYYTYKAVFTLTDLILALEGKFSPPIEIFLMMIKNFITRYIYQQDIPRYGVCHGDELAMLFHISMPMMPYVPKGHQDYDFSRKVINLWTSFAKSPKDISHIEFIGHKWLPLEPGQPLRYLEMDETPRMISEPFSERLNFWKSLDLK